MADSPAILEPVDALSPREIRFIGAYCLGKTAKEAARTAGMSDSTALRFLKTEAAQAEIAAQKERIRAAVEYDATAAMLELDEAANLARFTKDAKALTAAVRQKAELCGLIVKRELQIKIEKPSAIAAINEARARAGLPPRFPLLPAPVDPFAED